MADRAEIVADIVKCKEASSDSSVIVRASRLAKLPANIAAGPSDGVVAIGPAPICPDPDVSAAAAAPLKGQGFTVRTLCRPEVFIGAWLKVMPEVIRQGMHVELPLAVRGWEAPEHFLIEVSCELYCVRVSDTCGLCDVVLASLRVGGSFIHIQVAASERNKLVSAWSTADHSEFPVFGSFLFDRRRQ